MHLNLTSTLPLETIVFVVKDGAVKGGGPPSVGAAEPEKGADELDGGFSPGGLFAPGPNDGPSGSSSSTGSVDDLGGSLDVILS
jgi:hypothetical protein